MLHILPERIYQRGKRRIYYQASPPEAGKDVTVSLASPNMKKTIVTLMEFGHGLYYFDFDFVDLGDYIGTFFENGEVMGSGIFRIAL